MNSSVSPTDWWVYFMSPNRALICTSMSLWGTVMKFIWSAGYLEVSSFMISRQTPAVMMVVSMSLSGLSKVGGSWRTTGVISHS